MKQKGMILKCMDCGKYEVYRTRLSDGRRCNLCDGPFVPFDNCLIDRPGKENIPPVVKK